MMKSAPPRHPGSLRSQWNLSANQQLTLDLRFAHKLNKDLELAVTGRNLVGAKRVGYVSDYISSVPLEIAPSSLLSARWKF